MGLNGGWVEGGSLSYSRLIEVRKVGKIKQSLKFEFEISKF